MVVPQVSEESAATLRRYFADHQLIAQTVERVASVADHVADSSHDLNAVKDLIAELERDLIPHELSEETQLLPMMSGALGGSEALIGISRTHAEIEHQVLILRRLVTGMGSGPVDPDDVLELRRRLYVLYGVLRLHNAQEEEEIYSLIVT
jgi:hemerythrin superfamily protein